MQSIQSNKKLQFYSSFHMTQDASVQIDLIKNLQHRQSAVAKLRSSNHDLRIETGRHCLPKIPENVRICRHCSSNNIENELHFIFDCSLHSHAREKLFDDITFKYPIFTNFNTIDKTLFLFNNVHPFICKKKLRYFIFEGFQIIFTVDFPLFHLIHCDHSFYIVI